VSAERTVRAGGLRLHVREVGEGPPVLLINGLGAHTAMWGPLERALPDLRLISFDAPGVGASRVALPPPTIGMLAVIADALLDQLGYERVDVLGYSFGGAVAQELARRSPDRVRRLVLATTTPGWGGVPGSVRAMALACHPLRYFRRGYYERTIGQLAGGQARTDPEFVARHGAERLSRPPRLPGYYAQVAAITSWSSLGWLNEIGHPALVVAGGDDPLIPPVNSVILAHRMRRARLFLSPEEGHLLLMDDRSAALPAIRDFLAASSPAASAAWRDAREISAAAEANALAEHGIGAFPWGRASATFRMLNRVTS
jgi:pimeloyl-ACP methyl ester carboxylesterase